MQIVHFVFAHVNFAHAQWQELESDTSYIFNVIRDI
jgi:hypothetical protein